MFTGTFVSLRSVALNDMSSSVMPDGQTPKDYQKLQTSAASVVFDVSEYPKAADVT